MKKLIDINISLILFINLFPFVAIILFIVLIILQDYPIIKQKRYLTLNSLPIYIYKIRTIKRSKEFIRTEEQSKNILKKQEYKKYVPLFCSWLRKSGLDEIPQLLNIIKGEMSLVGPRPLMEKDLIILKDKYPDVYYKREIIKSKPGISGYWQIYGDRDLGEENLIDCDLYYEKNKSFLLEIKIILKTIFVILSATHSDAILLNKNKSKNTSIVKNIKIKSASI